MERSDHHHYSFINPGYPEARRILITIIFSQYCGDNYGRRGNFYGELQP